MGRRKRQIPPALVLADKPAGMGSAALVALLRKRLEGARVGHAGTLDRFATGLMVLLAGPATALADVLLHQDKDYLATFRFGRSTDTHDPEGETLDERDDEQTRIFMEESRARIESELGKLRDLREQVPPAYSALKRQGRRYSDLARSGTTILPAARSVRIDSLELTDYDPGAGSLAVRLSVSSGTYIRSLARDLGEGLGFPVHLGALRRLRIGAVSLEDPALWRPDRESESDSGNHPALLDPRRALPDWPTQPVNEQQTRDIAYGRKPSLGLDLAEGSDFFLTGAGDELLAWCRAKGEGAYDYRRVFCRPA